ncbi:MAG: hypothetical protein V4459_13445 [Pseudomonadota bacterium]
MTGRLPAIRGDRRLQQPAFGVANAIENSHLVAPEHPFRLDTGKALASDERETTRRIGGAFDEGFAQFDDFLRLYLERGQIDQDDMLAVCATERGDRGLLIDSKIARRFRAPKSGQCDPQQAARTVRFECVHLTSPCPERPDFAQFRNPGKIPKRLSESRRKRPFPVAVSGQLQCVANALRAYLGKASTACRLANRNMVQGTMMDWIGTLVIGVIVTSLVVMAKACGLSGRRGWTAEAASGLTRLPLFVLLLFHYVVVAIRVARSLPLGRGVLAKREK